MKKIIALFIMFMIVASQAFSFNIFAETVSTSDSELVVKTGSDFWINDWNYDRARSIKSKRYGSLKTDYYYNCFTRYRSIEMVDQDTYYSNVTEPYFILDSRIDLSAYLLNGTLRFWVDVPKDMTLRVTLISLSSSGTYARRRVSIDLKTDNEVENYQEVIIPLEKFSGENSTQSSWDPTRIRYIGIGGVSDCTAETFLANGEIINVSDIEIWSGEAPEPLAHDVTPQYYSKNGDYYIRDINSILDIKSQVSGFKNTLVKDSYIETVENYSNYVSLLEVYTVNVIVADSSEYFVSSISDYLEVYIPINTSLMDEELLVGTVSGDGITILNHTVSDGYLVVTTNVLGDILVMDNLIPLFKAETKYYTHSKSSINDNEKIENAILLNSSLTTAKDVTVFSESGENLPTLTNITNWLKSDGELRLWVKTPWRENNPKLSLKFDICLLYTNNSANVYPHTSANVKVRFDGLWHEIRIPATEFNDTVFDNILADETLSSTYRTFYFRVRSGETDAETADGEKIYLSSVEFFDTKLSTEVKDGNKERLAFKVSGNKKDSVADVTTTTVAVEDNCYITNAKKITRKDTDTDFAGKILLPYSANVSVAAGDSYNQLGSWFYTSGAEARTYVKNDSDSPVSFKIGLYGCLSYNSSTVYPKILTDYITLPANSGWQEIRFTLSDTDAYQERINQFTKGNGYIALEIYTKQNEFLNQTGDSLLVAPLEIYGLDIVEGVSTDFSKNYKLATKMEQSYIDSADVEGLIEKEVLQSNDLPFIKNALKIKASDSYAYSLAKEKPLGLFKAEPAFVRDFKDWALNPSSEMRLWIKSEKQRSFVLALTSGEAQIKTTVSVNSNASWQEIRLKRSDFSENTDFDNNFNSADVVNVYLSLYVLEDTFVESKEFDISLNAEFYSAKVYDMGDANLDESVDIRDLIRFKKLSAAQSGVFINCDIDCDERLTATDILYFRKRLIKNEW